MSHPHSNWTHSHWKRVKDEDLQKVFHCNTPDCKYKGYKMAVSSTGKMKIKHRCSNCGEHLEYSHTEVRVES